MENTLSIIDPETEKMVNKVILPYKADIRYGRKKYADGNVNPFVDMRDMFHDCMVIDDRILIASYQKVIKKDPVTYKEDIQSTIVMLDIKTGKHTDFLLPDLGRVKILDYNKEYGALTLINLYSHEIIFLRAEYDKKE